jgi:predicted glycosyltransferase
MDVDGTLVSEDRRRTPARALELRRERMLALHEQLRPEVVLVELFPFGRKKFAPELIPLLETARDAGALTVCSLRDILVGSRRDQARFEEVASVRANALLDAILVHADPRFARLEDSFTPATPLRVPVHYTGFVLPTDRAAALAPAPLERPRVLVSSGGGGYGGALVRAAVDAHEAGLAAAGVDVRIVAGPFLPDDEWRALRTAAVARPGLEAVRSVPDLVAELRAASASVSQCGYNTALDLLRTGVPALVVPFAEGREDEQTRRAERLERLGAVRVLASARADGPTLAREVLELLRFRPEPVALDLDGARKSALTIANLLARANAPAADPGRRPLVGVPR